MNSNLQVKIFNILKIALIFYIATLLLDKKQLKLFILLVPKTL